MIAATTYGAGRVLFVSHGGILGAQATLDGSGLGRLLANAAKWTAGSKAAGIRVAGSNNGVTNGAPTRLASLVSGLGRQQGCGVGSGFLYPWLWGGAGRCAGIPCTSAGTASVHGAGQYPKQPSPHSAAPVPPLPFQDSALFTNAGTVAPSSISSSLADVYYVE